MADDFTTDDDGIAGALGDDDDAGEQEQTLVTKVGLKKLKEELDHLKTVRRQEVAERLKEAISYGDLSENSEYEEAKNEQAFVEGRIIELDNKIKNAKIISDKKGKTSGGKMVEIGSIVGIRNKTKRAEPEKYTIVGSTEADPFENKISNESPIGSAILGKKKNDVVEVKAPAGTFKFEIVSVS